MLRLCLLVCVLLCLSRGVGDFDVPAIIYRNMAWNRSQREPAAAAAVNFGGGSQINFKVLFDETNAPLETRRAHDGVTLYCNLSCSCKYFHLHVFDRGLPRGQGRVISTGKKQTKKQHQMVSLTQSIPLSVRVIYPWCEELQQKQTSDVREGDVWKQFDWWRYDTTGRMCHLLPVAFFLLAVVFYGSDYGADAWTHDSPGDVCGRTHI